LEESCFFLPKEFLVLVVTLLEESCFFLPEGFLVLVVTVADWLDLLPQLLEFIEKHALEKEGLLLFKRILEEHISLHHIYNSALADSDDLL